MSSYFTTPWDYVGLMGGVIISIMMVPQIWKAVKTQSTGDLSWVFLLTYFLGLLMLGLYCFALRLLPIAIPWVIEMFLLVVQAVLKVILDHRKRTHLAQGDNHVQAPCQGATKEHEGDKGSQCHKVTSFQSTIPYENSGKV